MKEYFNGNVSTMYATQEIAWQIGSDHFSVTTKVIFCYTSDNGEKRT